MCDCKLCKNLHEPLKTHDGKSEYICPDCGGFHLIFDKHAGAVSCHDCGCFTTYGGERSINECLVKLKK